ncbi:MAG TPA: flagellar biosynthesis anti-sigma factor FlgM [Bacillota bacterium]
MIISSQQVNSVIKAYGVQGGKKGLDLEYAKPVQRGDSLVLSPKARELSKIRQAIANAPEIRSDVISRIKKSIDNGEYNVSSEAVAHRMLVRSLVDHIMGVE